MHSHRYGGRALTREGIDVLIGADGGVGRVVTVRQRLHERDNLVLLRIRQAEAPVVMSMLFGTSGIGQQVTFSTVPAGQCPDVT